MTEIKTAHVIPQDAWTAQQTSNVNFLSHTNLNAWVDAYRALVAPDPAYLWDAKHSGFLVNVPILGQPTKLGVVINTITKNDVEWLATPEQIRRQAEYQLEELDFDFVYQRWLHNTHSVGHNKRLSIDVYVTPHTMMSNSTYEETFLGRPEATRGHNFYRLCNRDENRVFSFN